MFILHLDLKNTIGNQEFHFLIKICEIRVEMQNCLLNESLQLFFLSEIFGKKNFQSSKLLESYRNVYIKSSAQRDYHDKNVFLIELMLIEP